jgi:RimJ/RimL family protein N-acetyltransferase
MAEPRDNTATEPDHAPAPIVNVAGELVALGPLERAHVALYQRWQNDPHVTRTLAASRPWTHEQMTSAFSDSAVASDQTHFTVYERATWRPIGSTYLADIDQRNGTAEFGIVIGATDARGRGYGTQATRLTLDYAFSALGLRNVLLQVYAFNEVGVRAYTKAGFHEIGRRHACKRRGELRWDVVYMEALAQEFESPALADVFAPDIARR